MKARWNPQGHCPFNLCPKVLSVLTCASLSTAYLFMQVLALSFVGTNGIRSVFQSWEKGHGLLQLCQGVEMLDIMVML